jgi:hypothetical protein
VACGAGSGREPGARDLEGARGGGTLWISGPSNTVGNRSGLSQLVPTPCSESLSCTVPSSDLWYPSMSHRSSRKKGAEICAWGSAPRAVQPRAPPAAGVGRVGRRVAGWGGSDLDPVCRHGADLDAVAALGASGGEAPHHLARHGPCLGQGEGVWLVPAPGGGGGGVRGRR